MLPDYPIFVPTKGRSDYPYTISMLERMAAPYHIVIEEADYQPYLKVVPDKAKILVLPFSNKGLTAARNWIWDYAQEELKTPYYWTLDDNIRDIVRLHKNLKWRLDCPTVFKIIEDFSARYSNLYISGMNYWMFVPRKKCKPPLTPNTRIYSNMLIKTSIPYRFVTFYNDDTDLCLRILKDGHCTMLFNVFQIDKIQTMRTPGGMTKYYKEETNERYEFVEELAKAHPDVVRLTKKWGRWHHKVDYSPFLHNRLIPNPAAPPVSKAIDEYDMVMVKLENEPPTKRFSQKPPNQKGHYE